MPNVIVKAIFKGHPGSLGYEFEKEYTIIVAHPPKKNIQIRRVRGGGYNEYESFEAFLKNWDNIRVLDEPVKKKVGEITNIKNG